MIEFKRWQNIINSINETCARLFGRESYDSLQKQVLYGLGICDALNEAIQIVSIAQRKDEKEH